MCYVCLNFMVIFIIVIIILEVSHHSVLKAVNIEALFDSRPVFTRQSFVPNDKGLYITLPYIV